MARREIVRCRDNSASDGMTIAFHGPGSVEHVDDLTTWDAMWDEAWTALCDKIGQDASMVHGSWTTNMQTHFADELAVFSDMSDDELYAVLAVMRAVRPFEFWLAACEVMLRQEEKRDAQERADRLR